MVISICECRYEIPYHQIRGSKTNELFGDGDFVSEKVRHLYGTLNVQSLKYETGQTYYILGLFVTWKFCLREPHL